MEGDDAGDLESLTSDWSAEDVSLWNSLIQSTQSVPYTNQMDVIKTTGPAASGNRTDAFFSGSYDSVKENSVTVDTLGLCDDTTCKDPVSIHIAD